LWAVTCAHAQVGFSPSSSEYYWSTTVAQLHLKGVQSRGILGEGVKVALLDTGLNLANPEFKGNPRVVATYNAVDGSSDVTDAINHGTHVAGVVMAGANGSGMYGVAPLASLLMVKVFNGGTASSSNITRGLDYALGQGARVINMSFGTTTPLADSGLRRAAARNQAVLGVAAGNEGWRSPNWPGRYAREGWANGTMLVVGAVDGSNRLANFSNKAGEVANFYLVAPGVNILSSYGTGYGYMSGTSMAAPAVSGAAALVTGYWPYLKANQVAAILLNTADDLGAPGVDAVYGHGLLNVTNALSPVGRYTYRAASGRTVTVPLSTQGQATRQPAAVSPSAFGGLQTEVFDDFGRNFSSAEGQALQARTVLTSDMVMGRTDLDWQAGEQRGGQGSLWRHVMAAPRVSAMRAAPLGVMSPLSAGRRPQDGEPWAAPFTAGATQWQSGTGWGFALGHGGLSATSLGLAGTEEGQALVGEATSLVSNPLTALSPAHRFAALHWSGPTQSDSDGWRWHGRLASLRPQLPTGVTAAQGHVAMGEMGLSSPHAALHLSVGQLDERGLLGGYASPALALGERHRTLGTTLSAAWRWHPRWSAVASWSSTTTAAPTASGLLEAGTAVRANAMGVGLQGRSVWLSGDRVSLSWQAPLKVQSGSYRYSVVTGVDAGGQPVFGQHTVNLGEGAREWQADARYGWRTGAGEQAGQWSAALTWRLHPDHDATAPQQWAGGVRYQQGF
ncbi:MAG: hypothetical protein RI907_311, partial [Pseudomonadota bacterium]